MSPHRQLHLDAPGSLFEYAYRPHVILFQIPSQIVGFDHSERGGEGESLALDRASRFVGGLIDQRCRSSCPALAAFFMNLRVRQFEESALPRAVGEFL